MIKPKKVLTSGALKRKRRPKRRVVGDKKLKASKGHYVLKAEHGAFFYRGVPIQLSFANDRRTKEVEEAMREFAKNEIHVIAE